MMVATHFMMNLNHIFQENLIVRDVNESCFSIYLKPTNKTSYLVVLLEIPFHEDFSSIESKNVENR